MPAASALVLLDARNDFDGMAALIAELDLVVSVDTSIAHLARRDGPTDLDPAAVRAGLALAARAKRQRLVSDCEALSPAVARRLGGRRGGRPDRVDGAAQDLEAGLGLDDARQFVGQCGDRRRVVEDLVAAAPNPRGHRVAPPPVRRKRVRDAHIVFVDRARSRRRRRKAAASPRSVARA